MEGLGLRLAQVVETSCNQTFYETAENCKENVAAILDFKEQDDVDGAGQQCLHDLREWQSLTALLNPVLCLGDFHRALRAGRTSICGLSAKFSQRHTKCDDPCQEKTVTLRPHTTT